MVERRDRRARLIKRMLESKFSMLKPSLDIFKEYFRLSSKVEEIIEEDKKITDYNDEFIYPLILDKTIEEVILEDKQIIESSLTNEVFPLDFELIKKHENAIKSEKFKNAVFDKSALKS